MIEQNDIDDLKLARSVSVTDLWDIDERLDRLSDCVERIEKVLEGFILLYHEERKKNWEMILRKMLEKEEAKKGNKNGNRAR